MKLKRYKRNIISKSQRIIISFFLILFTLGIGYAALTSNLSISGNIVVKEYDDPNLFNKIVRLEDNNSCITKYEGQVTDQVGQTVTASKVYFNKCADKRNIIFNNMCFQMIRTTETGGIKMIYNGDVVDGKCESSRGDHKGIFGYDGSSRGPFAYNYLYGDSFTYDITNNTFTLDDPFTSKWSDSTYKDLIGKFSCQNTTGTCTNLVYVNGYYSNTDSYYSTYKIDNTNYSQIGKSVYNINTYSSAKVGYMYNKEYHRRGGLPSSGALVGNDVSYSNGVYTLLPAQGESSLGTTLDATHHYTCDNTTGICSKVRYYFYYYSMTDLYQYIELDGEENINEAINNMFYSNDVNRYNSNVKAILDSWYKQNMLDKTSMLEDIVFCNGRSIADYGGWNKDGALNAELLFKNNAYSSNDLSCINETDQFAVSNNKAKLTYPVAIISSEEVYNIDNQSLMRTGAAYLTISPNSSSNYDSSNNVNTIGSHLSDTIDSSYGIRPVITLSSDTVISSGDGSESNPWIVNESPLNTTIDTYNNRLKDTYLSDTYRDKIKTITLGNSINVPNNAVISWDIGVNQNNKIMAYLLTNNQDNTMYDLYIQGDGELKANADSSYLFSEMSNLESINNLTILDTSNVINMYRMFSSSYKLTTLDLSNFNTSKVTNMHDLFAGMRNDETQVNMQLQNIIGLNDLDTSSVTNMAGIFFDCGKMQTIDISNWDTHNVKTMANMFNNVNDMSSVLTTIIFGPNFDTSNVEDMSYMFTQNPLLKNLDVSNFDTSKVKTMAHMFYQDWELENINVSNFNTENVETMFYMFADLLKVSSLDVSNFNTSKVKNMAYMFHNCPLLTDLNLSDWETSSVTDMNHMFQDNTSLKTLRISKFSFGNVTNSTGIFSNMPTKTQGMKLYVKDITARTWVLTLSSGSKPTDWDTTNVLIG